MKTTLNGLKEILAETKSMFTDKPANEVREHLVSKYGMSESNANFFVSVAAVEKHQNNKP